MRGADMHDNNQAVSFTDDNDKSDRHPLARINSGEATLTEEKSKAIPKPVFVRLLMLFGGGLGCLIVGIVVSMVTGDRVLLGMSAILCVSFVIKGFFLKRKIRSGHIYGISGVCVSIVPKIFGRYRRIELVDTATGGDLSFILPKKVVFKVGHVYTCYFDNQINNRSAGNSDPQGGFFSTDIDLPTNGFLGYEDFGIYQERPITATAAVDNTARSDEAPPR